jgi:Zn-dependent protease
MLDKALGSVAGASVAVICHELAHVAVASALRVRVYQIGIAWKGLFIRREPGTVNQNLVITLAGPATNLLIALLWHRTNPGFALSNFVLGLCNLLPFASSDGSRALSLIKGMRGIIGSPLLPEKGHVKQVPAELSRNNLRQEAA